MNSRTSIESVAWVRTAPYVAAAVTLLSLSPMVVTAQSVSVPQAPRDTSTLGRDRYARMHTLLEKTIFRVDVLTAEVWLSAADARRVGEAAAGRRHTSELSDTIAALAIHSQDALVRLEFVRDVSFGQFLDGIEDNLRLVPRAGMISDSDYRRIAESLPRWFAFLEGRGVHKGDRLVYRIRGDTLRTRYLAVEGGVLLDQTDIGAAARLSVLGSYFVDGSEFREGLIGSLFAKP